jgi:hypothetical protein
MGVPPLSPQEKRLSAFCKFFAVLYFLGAVGFAAFPALTFRLVTMGEPSSFGEEVAFWNVLAVAMMVAISAACAVVAPRPRERRHALLPVIGAKLTSSVLAALHVAGGGGRALLAVILTDFPLFVVTLLLYRSAAPGVHSEPARTEAPQEAPQPIQISIPK